MAHAHFMKPSTFLNLYIKNNRNAYVRKDLDFYSNEEFFQILQSKSILSIEQIMNMSLRSEEGYLFTNTGLYPPKQIRKLIDKRSHYGLMYCPKCLAEDRTPYWRKHWRYSFYTACPKHKVFLTDRCWHCYTPIKLLKMDVSDKIVYCSHCGADLSLTNLPKIPSNYLLQLPSIDWFENGLQRGYFKIDSTKVWSAMFFYVLNRLRHLLNTKENLRLDEFPLTYEYMELCKRLAHYHSTKMNAVKRNFILNGMIFYLFKKFPTNFINFINQNHIVYREFTHGFKYIPYWYERMLAGLIPKENKKGRLISKNEVLGAIEYLKRKGKIVNQLNVAEIVGCHFTIHKGFLKIYKNISS